MFRIAIIAALSSLATTPSTAQTIQEHDEAVVAATQAYRNTGTAAVLSSPVDVRYPFGRERALVECIPLVACDVQLQAGERILAIAVGDSERWLTDQLTSGDPGNPVPHVIIKPTDYDLLTNAVVGTDRRTYHLTLASPPKARTLEKGFQVARAVSFYYPDELVQVWRSAEHDAAAAAKRRADASLAPLAVDPAAINTDYTVRAKGKVRWAPTTVFDDGSHVYLFMPPEVLAGEAPAFVGKTAEGGDVLLNHRQLRDGRTWVVDGLFDQAELVLGKETVSIRRGGR